MSWKSAYRSFYYQGAPEPEDLDLKPEETAMLCIDVQNYGMAPRRTRPSRPAGSPSSSA